MAQQFKLKEFVDGGVVIDFRDFTQAELHHLQKICKLIQPNRDYPAYTFGPVYFCKDARWYEGGIHHLVGAEVCRATDIQLA